MFLHPKLKGVPVPFHTDFEEAKLRFHVRRDAPELLPKPAIAAVARLAYSGCEVGHPLWRVHPVEPVAVRGDLAGECGQRIGAALDRPPDTAFVAFGSEVVVRDGARRSASGAVGS